MPGFRATDSGNEVREGPRQEAAHETRDRKHDKHPYPARDGHVVEPASTSEALTRATLHQTLHVMSLPQHNGDLILPCPLGHSATRTLAPSSVVMEPSTRSAPQCPQVTTVDMEQAGQE